MPLFCLCATPNFHDSIWGIISRWDRDRSIHGNWLHSISSLHFHKSLWGILKTKDTLRLFIWPVTTASWCYVKTIAHWWIWSAMNFYTGSNHSSGTSYVWLFRTSPLLAMIWTRSCDTIPCVFVRYVIRQMLKYIKVRRPSYVRLEQRWNTSRFVIPP